MRKKTTAGLLLILLLCLSMLAGCGADKEAIQSEFSTMVAAAATPETIKSTAEYLDKNISLVGEEIAGKMAVSYEKYLLRFIKENGDGAASMKSSYADLKAGGIAIVYDDEIPTMKLDYASFYKKYGGYVPKPLQQLYRLEADIYRKPLSDNAVLKISWTEILDRAYRAERLMEKYPGQKSLQTDAQWIYTTYLNAALMGTTNTPVFDYKTHAFSSDAKAAYIEFIRKYPDSALTWALTEYFRYLDSTQYSLDYKDATMSKVFFDTCDFLVTKSVGKVTEAAIK
jgi:hypothetical protein